MMNKRLYLMCLMVSIFLFCSPSLTRAETLPFDYSFQLVDANRVGRCTFEYTFKIIIKNKSAGLRDVSFSFQSNSPHTIVTDGHAVIGDIGPDAKVTSDDTLSFSHDRRYPFDHRAITWKFEYGLIKKAYIPELDFSKHDVYGNGQVVYVSNPEELQQAINNAAPYTTILLKDGEYHSCHVVFPKSLHHITIKAQNRHRAVIYPLGNDDGAAFYLPAASSETEVNHHVNFINLAAKGGGLLVRSPSGSFLNPHHVYLKGIKMSGLWMGIYSGVSSHDWTVDGCEFYDSKMSYIWYMMGWHQALINSVMYNNSYYSVAIRGCYPPNEKYDYYHPENNIRIGSRTSHFLSSDDWTHLIANNTFGSNYDNRRLSHAHIALYYDAEEGVGVSEDVYFPPQNVMIVNNACVDNGTGKTMLSIMAKRGVNTGRVDGINGLFIQNNAIDQDTLILANIDISSIDLSTNHLSVPIEEFGFDDSSRNYQIYPGSILENGGTRSLMTLPPWDFTGSRRDEVPDIGAFEVSPRDSSDPAYDPTHDTITVWGGKKDNQGTGGYYPRDDADAIRGLVFDAHKPFILKSVKVYNQKGHAANRTFALYDRSGKQLAQKTLFVKEGEQRISLDFYVPKGNGFRLLADTHKGLYRNKNVNYPILVGDVATITGSNIDREHYYFFYDWEVVTSASSGSEPPDGGNDTDQTTSPVTATPIVLIGPSTVYISHEMNEAVREDYKTDCRLEGWGERLYEYAQYPNTIYNYAHPGANTSTFMMSPQEVGRECNEIKDMKRRSSCLQELKNFGPNRDHYWGGAKEKMKELGGGILLIQFGANEKVRDERRFKNNIRKYIREAKQLNFTPILITEIEKRIRENGVLKRTRGDYPKWMKEVAEEEGVRVLDLNEKSYQEYSKYSDKEWDEMFANCYNRWTRNKQKTHFEPKGARIVAGWIKELACAQGYENSELCILLSGADKEFELSSDEFIPDHGSPSFSWKNPPVGVKSYAIIIDDHDAKDDKGRNWVHWVVFNINKDVKSILPNSIPADAIVERNSLGVRGYAEPKFPQSHTYVAHIYALDVGDITQTKYANGVPIYKKDEIYDHMEFEKVFANFILEHAKIDSSKVTNPDMGSTPNVSDAAARDPVFRNIDGVFFNSYYGARVVPATPLEKGTVFASPNGSGEQCSQDHPCAITQAIRRLKPGDVLFLKGGIYHIRSALTPPSSVSGTSEKPIIIESYPGELAVLDGGVRHVADITPENKHTQLKLRHNNYIHIRKLEVRHMPAEGIAVFFGSHNVVEGCNVHHNIGTGIAVNGGEWHEDRPNYTIPYKYGYNEIRNNISHHNSDVETSVQGDNADGIWIGSGKYNKVIHNTLFANSDDGIDTWRSNHTYVAYNFSYDNGRGPRGNGNGIKAGGNRNPKAGNGIGTKVRYNISFKNRRNGFNYNSGRNVEFIGNVAYKNGRRGFVVGGDTMLRSNIALENGLSSVYPLGLGDQRDNSWQAIGEPTFMSTDPNSENFLVVGLSKQVFLIGDSTVHNTDLPDGNGGFLELGWGDALLSMAKSPEHIHNLARSGASTLTYDNNSIRNNWSKTKALIVEQSDLALKNHHLIEHFLLIQFGHNEQSPDVYYEKLKSYIKFAQDNDMIPVLITPVNRFYPGVYHHQPYVAKMRALAREENVTLLDLNERSFREFSKEASDEEVMRKFGYDDHTHFNPQGAKIVAGWVVDLICEQQGYEMKTLCSMFERDS